MKSEERYSQGALNNSSVHLRPSASTQDTGSRSAEKSVPSWVIPVCVVMGLLIVVIIAGIAFSGDSAPAAPAMPAEKAPASEEYVREEPAYEINDAVADSSWNDEPQEEPESAASSASTMEEEAYSEVEEPGHSLTEGKWNTYEMSYTDDAGYNILQKLTISPMVYAENTEMVEALWGDLGGTVDEIPDVEQCFNLRHNWKSGQMDRIMYIFGTLEAYNHTEGFEITSEHPHSVSFRYLKPYDDEDNAWYLEMQENGTLHNELILDHFMGGHTWDAYEITKIFYSDDTAYYGGNGDMDGGYACGDVFYMGGAHMVSDEWGPIRFVMVFPNICTPAQPDGFSVYNHLRFNYGDNDFKLDIIR